MNSSYSLEYKRASNLALHIKNHKYLSKESKFELLSAISKRESSMEDLDKIENFKNELLVKENKRKCKHCGKEIIIDVTNKNWLRIEFCTDSPCRKKYFIQKVSERRHSDDPNFKYGQEKLCVECGEPLSPERAAGSAKTCSIHCSYSYTKKVKKACNARHKYVNTDEMIKLKARLRNEIKYSDLPDEDKKMLLDKTESAKNPEDINILREKKINILGKNTKKFCKFCGKEIPYTGSKGWHKVQYCADTSCYQEELNRVAREKRKTDTKEHTCIICGKPASNGYVKYCSDRCHTENKRLQSAVYRRNKGILPIEIARLVPKPKAPKVELTPKERAEKALAKNKELLESATSMSDMIMYSKRIVNLEKKLGGM